MKVMTDSGIFEFEPAFSLDIVKKTRPKTGEEYYSIAHDPLDAVGRVAKDEILGGYFWFFASQIEGVRNRLAAKGIGLRIVEDGHEV